VRGSRNFAISNSSISRPANFARAFQVTRKQVELLPLRARRQGAQSESKEHLDRAQSGATFKEEAGFRSKGRVAQIGLTGKKKVPQLGEMC
jgi:hypothetical protein